MTPKDDKPREWTLHFSWEYTPISRFVDCCVDGHMPRPVPEKGQSIKIPVIEKSAYDKLKDELEKSDALAHKWQSEWADIHEENKKYRKAMYDIMHGMPSEWAYTILKKERDELRIAYGKKCDSFENCLIHYNLSQDRCVKLKSALEGLLNDTQHSDHDCGDEMCPVEIARKALEEKP
jgi:hypothetical protein